MDSQINKSVERYHFHRCRQQTGESFYDFLVSLHELAKTCKFCSDNCSQKSIHDQIIEGLLDSDVVEDLLKDKELTLADAISRCGAQEAAKQQRAEITHIPLENTFVQTVKIPYHAATPQPPQPMVATCPGCGSGPHQGGRQCCPT